MSRHIQTSIVPTGWGGANRGQGAKPKWKHQPTTTIRVPVQIAPHLLLEAKRWDTVGKFNQVDRAVSLLRELEDRKKFPRNNASKVLAVVAEVLALLEPE